MQNLKPFQVILMVAFGLIALAGLFMFATFKGFNTGATAIGNVTIWGTIPADAMEQALGTIRQADTQYAGVKYVARPAATFDTDLAEAIAAGTGPDMVLLSEEDLLAAKNKLSVIPSSSISERTFRDTYLPISELFLTSGGTYGIPFMVDPLMMYYNRPILASVGATSPPSTWEAVTGLASAINRESGVQTLTRSLIALGTYDNVENSRAILSLLFLQAGYSVTAESSSGMRSTLTQTLGGATGVLPSESALDFYTEFANPAKTVYSWNRSLPDSRQAFLSGDLGLYLGFASERPGLAAANPNLDFDMTVVPSPATASIRTTYARVYAFALPKSSRNAQGAYRVAMGFSGKGTDSAFAHALGMAPATRAALIPTKDDLFEPVYFPEALIAKGWLSPAPPATDRIFATMVGNVMSGKSSVRDALIFASQALDAAIK